MTDPESITRLRQMTAGHVEVTPATVAAWVHSLRRETWRGPADIAARPTRVPARDAKGRYIRQQTFSGRANEIVSVPVDQFLADLADLGHFVHVTADQLEEVEARIGDPRWDDVHLVAVGEQRSLFPTATDKIAFLSSGFSRRMTGRDLKRSLARVVTAQPDADTIVRWVLRRYWGIRPQLTYPTVATVAKIAALGRIEELDEVAHIGGPANSQTAAVLVEAWDFLAVGVADIHRAVDRIIADARRSDIDLDAVELDWAVVRLRVLHEGFATRLARELAAARDAHDPSLWRAAAAELARRAVTDREMWHPGVADLNDGQVLRLVQHAGIPTTEPDHRIEGDVRGWMLDAELGSELASPLLWHGVNLHAAGHGDKFRAALERRKARDLEWADELNELGVGASSAAA
jgi:hypothetical protein